MGSIKLSVKQLTKICWHLICYLDEVGLSLVLGLVTSCSVVRLHVGDLLLAGARVHEHW